MNTTNAPAVTATATAPATAPKKNRAVSRMTLALAPVRSSLRDAATADKVNKRAFAIVTECDAAVARGKAGPRLADKFTAILAPLTDKEGNVIFTLPADVAEKAREGAREAAAGNVPSREIRNTFKALTILLDTAYRAAHDMAREKTDARRDVAEDVAAKKTAAKSGPSKAELENENAMLKARLAELEAKAAAPAITAA